MALAVTRCSRSFSPCDHPWAWVDSTVSGARFNDDSFATCGYCPCSSSHVRDRILLKFLVRSLELYPSLLRSFGSNQRLEELCEGCGVPFRHVQCPKVLESARLWS